MSLLDAHPCTQCDRRFNSASGLRIHVGRMHKVHIVPHQADQAEQQVEQLADQAECRQEAAIQNPLDELLPLEAGGATGRSGRASPRGSDSKSSRRTSSS